MNKIILSKSKISYNKKIYKEYDILFEIFKGIKYCKLLEKFIITCVSNLPENIFQNKKSVKRTLTNLYSTWFFSLYSSYDFKDDPFFPTNYSNTNTLKDILMDYCDLNKDIINKEKKIELIVKNTCYNYQKTLNYIKNYGNNSFYSKNKNNFTINKNKFIEERYNKKICFYKFSIKFNFLYNINDFRFNNILENLIIPEITYEKMKNKYNGFPDELDKYIFILLLRYQLLGSNNHQLGILPKIIEKIKSDFNTEIECFASAINSETEYFCSIYYDIEKFFGSIGSFFNIKIDKGIFTFNPPYQKDIIEKSINQILYFMEESKEKIGFIITIPIWDNYGKIKMKEMNMENNNNNINYGDFKIMNKIRESKFFYGLRMISKNDFTYLDHNFYLFKNTTIQNTYVIVLANFKNNYIEIINNYNFFE